jgi:hypothetical protein
MQPLSVRGTRIASPIAAVAVTLVVLIGIAGTAGGQPFGNETTRNAERIEAINHEAGPLGRELTQVQSLIQHHNSVRPDQHDHAAVDAYNARSNELNDRKSVLLKRLRALQEEQDRLTARNRSLEATGDAAVQREQDEFDRMNETWLRSQAQLIRDAAARDSAWRGAVLAALRNIHVPEPAHRPHTMADLLPGDVVLLGPAKDWSQAIPPTDFFYRVANDLARGHVFAAIDRRPAPASHALSFVKRANGVMLFLDHTHEGSRILSTRDFERKYQGRKVFVARPSSAPDGKLLWAAARDAALRQKPYFGILPGQLVCSDQVCVALTKAGVDDLANHRLGPIDITPGDFFDPEGTGKYFIVSPLDP